MEQKSVLHKYSLRSFAQNIIILNLFNHWFTYFRWFFWWTPLVAFVSFTWYRVCHRFRLKICLTIFMHKRWMCLFVVKIFNVFLPKQWRKVVRELQTPTRGQFHQHVYAQLLCAKIPKVQKDSQVISVVLHFCDLGA